MSDSIVKTLRPRLGVDEDDDSYDTDILTPLNTYLAVLRQRGVKSMKIKRVVDHTATWSDLISNEDLDLIQEYLYLRVKLIFDPPSSSTVLQALTVVADELEWRIVDADRTISV